MLILDGWSSHENGSALRSGEAGSYQSWAWRSQSWRPWGQWRTRQTWSDDDAATPGSSAPAPVQPGPSHGDHGGWGTHGRPRAPDWTHVSWVTHVPRGPDWPYVTSPPAPSAWPQAPGPGPALMTAAPRVPLPADAEPDVRSGAAQSQ